MHDLRDTIVAVSSAAGGVRSIVRVTGPQTLPICAQVFAPSPEARISNLKSEISNLRSQISSRTILPGSVCIREDLAVDALLYPFLAPHSYTGEDLVELHVFGAACFIEALLERLLASGCRAAGPGEFTARAYLNGKLDLAQAEAVNEIVSSSNSLQLDAAERLLGGRLTEAIEGVRSALLDTLSLIEAGLDFSGEDIEFIGKEQAAQRLTDVQRQLEDLLAGSIRYETLMDLPAVGIAGAPNAGKSSLLNALLGWERSIVSPQAKTTRDVLTGVLYISRSTAVPAVGTTGILPVGMQGQDAPATHGRDAHATEMPGGVTANDASGRSFQCILFDCAGLIPAPDNILDELAQRAALLALQRCTAVLFCVDSAKADWTEDLAIRSLIQPKRLICVATKSDLTAGENLPRRMQELAAVFGAGFLSVSATKRAGLEKIVRAIESAVCSVPVRAYLQGQGTITPYGVTTSEETDVLALTARHRQAVTEAVENVRQAIAEVEQGREEVAVMMIRAACEAVSGIEQQHLDEQVLDRIFSRFCVGK